MPLLYEMAPGEAKSTVVDFATFVSVPKVKVAPVVPFAYFRFTAEEFDTVFHDEAVHDPVEYGALLAVAFVTGVEGLPKSNRRVWA